MNENRISIEMTTEKVEEIKALLAQVEEKLPFLISLTADERTQFPSLNRDNELFVVETMHAAEQHQAVLPAYINTDEMAKDLELFQQLSRVMLRLNHLHQKVQDTMQIAGAEAFGTALVVNNMFQIAAKMGVDGMDEVSTRLTEVFSTAINDQ